MKQTLDDKILEFRGYLFKCHRLMQDIEKEFSKYENFQRKLKENREDEHPD